ncbi:ATP-grasp domain-containing protein [Candidatus Nitrosopelagicus sp.]|nr:ATP-grasp domain-containing protein [Candidatus Nitrosopelagicus sp.]
MSCNNDLKLLLLGAGIEQKIVIDHAHELDAFVIAVDSNPDAIGLKFADKSIVSDIKNIDEMSKIAKDEEVDGVFTHAIEIPHVVAEVAKRNNLPGIDPSIAYNATNKLERIKIFKDNDIPSPKFEYASSLDETIEKAKKFELPFVLKPIDSAGARGVSKVETYSDIPNLYQEAILSSTSKIILLEEYLEGPEVSTEAIIVDGEIITTGFADRNYSEKQRFKPFFIENGHTIPSILSDEMQKKVIETTENAIKSLKINFGAAKGDVIIDHGTPKILEMAARTSGGRFCSDTVPLSTGINILKPLIQMSLGLKPNKDFLTKKHNRAVAQRYFLPQPGKISSINGLSECNNLPGIYDIFLRSDVSNGYVIKKIKNHLDRLGHVISFGSTRDEAIQNAERGINCINFEVSQ